MPMGSHPLILEQLVAGRREDLGRRVEARRALREAGRRGLAVRAVGSLTWHVGEALVQLGARLRDGQDGRAGSWDADRVTPELLADCAP